MYTKEDVIEMIVALCMFSGANNNQGLKEIKGETFGDKAETVIKSFDERKESQSIISIIAKLRG